MVTLYFLYTYSLSGLTGIAPIGSDALSQDNFLVVLTRVAWIILPIVLTIFGNRYFRKRDEEKKQHSEVLNKLAENIDKLEKTLIPMMVKIENTAMVMADVMRDVKEHDKIISRISALLEQRGQRI